MKNTDDNNGCGMAQLTGVEIMGIGMEPEAIKKIRMLHC